MFINHHKIDYLYGSACEMLVPFYDVYASCGLPTEQGDIPPEMIKVPGGDFDGLNTYSISVKGDYQTFCNLVAYVLPHHQHLPNKNEVGRMAVDCFAKPFDTWTDAKAPVHGEYYKNYHRAGEAILEKLTECSQKLPQSSHINSSSH